MIENEPVNNGIDDGIFDQFDDDRILNGQVSSQEQKELEEKILQMYFQRAKAQGEPINIISDVDRYNSLKKSGELYDGNVFYLLTDELVTNVLALNPVIYRMSDTLEGRFLAKLMLHAEDHQN